MINNNLADKINDLTRKNLPFAFYYHPDQPEPHLIAQTNHDLIRVQSCKEISGASGFILAPFIPHKETPVVLLRPDIYLTDTLSVLALNTSTLPYYSPFNHHDALTQAERGDYIRTVEELITQIKQKKMEKVVLSRIMSVPFPSEYSPGVFVQSLKERMGSAFVYFLHLPEIGTWMGATPEVLFTTQKGYWKTTSIAGTLPASAISAEIPWGHKEQREQEIVTEFIEEQLQAFGIQNYEKTGPYTVYAGQVAHLKTDIEFTASENHEERERFINALHPTPAVCGTPREKAMACIESYERHKREYYCGFLGEWNLQGETKLHVNLRCMKISGQNAFLFVGGGITADSSPEKEWEETDQKAQTLLSLLRPCL